MRNRKIDIQDTGEIITIQNSSQEIFAALPESERILTSRYGYKVPCKDYSGSWLPEIRIPNDAGNVVIVKTEPFFSGIYKYDAVASSLLTHLIKSYDPKTVINYGEGVWLVTSRLMQNESVQEAILNAIPDIKSAFDLTAIKRLCRYFLMTELEDYSYDFHQEIQSLAYGGTQNSHMKYNLSDAEEGPFMREELVILNNALENPHIHLEGRVIMGLMIEWGLRPIQISLLKQRDLEVREVAGEVLYHVNVPRVKQRAKERRTKFTKRPVSRKLGEMIDELIQIHQAVYADLEIKDPPLIMRSYKLFARENPYQRKAPEKLLRDLKAGNGTWEESFRQPENFFQEVYDIHGKSDLGHHIDSSAIQHRLNSIVPFLPRSPRTGREFNLTGYRFRYTKGTSMVQEGYTPAEVADALDHSDTSSVKHYFRETAEMNELVEEATNRRVEQKMWVAAWQRTEDVENNIYGTDIVELTALTTVGKCKKGSPCWLEPAVSCYGCDKFKPNTDAEGHKNALKRIEAQILDLSEMTYGQTSHQLDEARAGCLAAIAFAEGDQVVFISDGAVATKDEVIGYNTPLLVEGDK